MNCNLSGIREEATTKSYRNGVKQQMWFNIAASKGDEYAKKSRAQMAKKITSSQSRAIFFASSI